MWVNNSETTLHVYKIETISEQLDDDRSQVSNCHGKEVRNKQRENADMNSGALG